MCRPTWDTCRLLSVFGQGAVTLYGPTSQTVVLTGCMSCSSPATPSSKPGGLGFSAFVRHYLRLISCPSVTEMFHFTESRLCNLWIQLQITEHYFCWIAPFGYPRIKAFMQLPEAFRSLTRPSSPADAKASFMCPM